MDDVDVQEIRQGDERGHTHAEKPTRSQSLFGFERPLASAYIPGYYCDSGGLGAAFQAAVPQAKGAISVWLSSGLREPCG